MTPMGTNYKIQSPFWIFLKPFTNEPFARFDSKILHVQISHCIGKARVQVNLMYMVTSCKIFIEKKIIL
jgi:hypothetical protein